MLQTRYSFSVNIHKTDSQYLLQSRLSVVVGDLYTHLCKCLRLEIDSLVRSEIQKGRLLGLYVVFIDRSDMGQTRRLVTKYGDSKPY